MTESRSPRRSDAVSAELDDTLRQCARRATTEAPFWQGEVHGLLWAIAAALGPNASLAEIVDKATLRKEAIQQWVDELAADVVGRSEIQKYLDANTADTQMALQMSLLMNEMPWQLDNAR